MCAISDICSDLPYIDCSAIPAVLVKAKYNTKPIDYSGCHPAIAEYLRKGEQIECIVWNSDQKLKKWPTKICMWI